MLVVIPLMLALNLAFLSANLLELSQGGGRHLGETKPMAAPAAAKLGKTAVVAPRSDRRSAVAAGSSGLLAAEALDPRYPPGGR
jgi:hypothetical protein